MGTRMARGVTLAATALLSLLLFAMPAGAGWEWCEGDPVVALNGTQLQIKAAIQRLDRREWPSAIVVSKRFGCWHEAGEIALGESRVERRGTTEAQIGLC